MALISFLKNYIGIRVGSQVKEIVRKHAYAIILPMGWGKPYDFSTSDRDPVPICTDNPPHTMTSWVGTQRDPRKFNRAGRRNQLFFHRHLLALAKGP